jgi:MFS family permease
VLLAGVFGAMASMFAMSQAQSSIACVVAQLGYGLSSGAFWPFASAWLMDFEGPGISKTRALRHYNVSWTSGTALGMFIGGILCEHGLIRQAVGAGAVLMVATFITACFGKATAHDHRQTRIIEKDSSVSTPHRVGLALVLAAVIANLMALGTRTIILNNYAELNNAQGFGANRMGIINALPLVVQLISFGIGSIYEHWLGLRRIYIFFGVALIAVNIAFAYSAHLGLLVPMVILHGIVLAMAFQTGIFAAIGYFSSARTGTTFHEAVIGAGGIAPLLAGVLVSHLKTQSDLITALQAPFLYMAALIFGGLIVQIILTSFYSKNRMLLKPHKASPSEDHTLAV